MTCDSRMDFQKPQKDPSHFILYNKECIFFFNLRGNQIGECINLANPKAAANSILKCMSFYLTITLLIH